MRRHDWGDTSTNGWGAISDRCMAAAKHKTQESAWYTVTNDKAEVLDGGDGRLQNRCTSSSKTMK
ncbi:hypothetical protein Syun_004190 [Stephania yunnanensis]|uniref:Uncharacterized protein n=1 Tax=Stephania yunnanensis TaxID=152371 RepID=A0AAP0L2K2_9MAGN